MYYVRTGFTFPFNKVPCFRLASSYGYSYPRFLELGNKFTVAGSTFGMKYGSFEGISS